MTKRFTQLGCSSCLPNILRGAKIILLFLLISVMNLLATPAMAKGKSLLQKIKISGVVTSSKDQQAIPGVTVKIKNTNQGTITDLDGKYMIEVPNNAVLIFSFLGFKTEEKTVGDQTNIDVAMTEDDKALQEIVVVGYGTQKKKDLTGSVSSIDSKELKSVSVASVGDALEGKASGVQILSSGTPGDNVTIRVRGISTINNNDPLIVVDGIPSSFGLNQLNMDDIETMQVLKDASACAIYGSRGANGVVIVTTKRGKGSKSHLEINTYSGVQTATKLVKMLNASQFATLHNEMMANNGQALNPAFSNPSTLGAGTDWEGALFRSAQMQNLSVSYAGSSDLTNYYVSGNVFNQDGIVIGTNYKKYTFQINTDSKLFSNLKVGNNLTFTNDYKTSGGYNIQNTLSALPTQPIYRNGDYSGPVAQPSWAGNIVNPIGSANTVKNTTVGYNLLGSFYVELELLEGLKIKSTYGVQMNLWNDRSWSPKYKWDSSIQDNSYLYEQSNKSITWNWDNMLTYEKIYNTQHHFTLLAGTSVQANRYDYMSGSVQGFASNNTQQLSNGTLLPTINGSANEWSLMSYIGRANYSFADRYLITATLRRDGSSRFGENNKWGVFPSGSVAWRISEEKFFKNVKYINDFKLRAGIGVTGNQNIGNYDFASSLNTIRYTFNNNTVPAVVPTVMPNPNIQWEEVRQSNLGFDLALFKDRISLTVDAYIKNTNKMLVNMVVPAFTGYSDIYVPLVNAGELENKGIEFSVSTKNMVGEFKWSSNFNISVNQNKILNMNDTVPLATGSIGLNYQLARLQAGHPINQFYGYVTDGIFQTQAEVDKHAVQVPGKDVNNRTSAGDIRFKDINNDGVINEKDRVYLGNPNPSVIFALGNTFSYKGFDLNIFFQGVAGNKIFNATRLYNEAMSVAMNQTTATLDRWTGENTSNSMPRAVFNDPNQNNRASNRYIEDGSYLRLKTLSLGYTLPKSWLKAAKLETARLYVSAQNLYTFTKYTGLDPEVAGNGIDQGTYPVTRTVSVGANISF